MFAAQWTNCKAWSSRSPASDMFVEFPWDGLVFKLNSFPWKQPQMTLVFMSVGSVL